MARPLANGMAHVDIMLEQWAAWGKQNVGLGWPPWTLLAKVMEQGFAGASQPGPVPEMSEMVQLVERAVLRLRPSERAVITKWYVYWQPLEVCARYCDVSPGRFKTLLSSGRRSVADYIDGAYCSHNSTGISATCQITL